VKQQFAVPQTVQQAMLRILQTWASAGGETDICPPLEIETKKQKFLENVKSEV